MQQLVICLILSFVGLTFLYFLCIEFQAQLHHCYWTCKTRTKPQTHTNILFLDYDP